MSIDFHCPACGLKGHVSGGEDADMLTATTTIYCEVCETLQDVHVGDHADFPEGRVEPRCEKRKRHRIQLWQRNEPCPRCGEGLLQEDANGMVTMWD